MTAPADTLLPTPTLSFSIRPACLGVTLTTERATTLPVALMAWVMVAGRTGLTTTGAATFAPTPAGGVPTGGRAHAMTINPVTDRERINLDRTFTASTI